MKSSFLENTTYLFSPKIFWAWCLTRAISVQRRAPQQTISNTDILKGNKCTKNCWFTRLLRALLFRSEADAAEFMYACKCNLCVCLSEWQELIKVCSGSSVLVICPAIPQGTNSMCQDLAVKAARHIMHYEEKFISLFLCPFTSLSCTYAIVNWQTCQWLISPGVRPPHLVLALASPYLASVSSLSLIRGNGGSRSWVKKKNEKKKEV